jgi:hypothetical protein
VCLLAVCGAHLLPFCLMLYIYLPVFVLGCVIIWVTFRDFRTVSL